MNIEELAGSPISAEQPCGSDIRYEPAMEQLATEMEKLNNPTATPIDWLSVANAAEEILSKQSKDILVASYLGVALLQNNGMQGLDEGLRLLKNMTGMYWEPMFPPIKRMRGRQQAIQWWADRTVEWLKSAGKNEQEKELVESLNQNLQDFDSFLAGVMDEPPSLSDMKGMLAMIPVHVDNAAETQPASSSSATEAKAQKTSIAQGLPQGEGITDTDAAEKALKQALGVISKVADFLMDADLSDPRAYRLSRMAAWSSVEATPPATAKKTMIPPPPKQLRQALETMEENAAWENLLKAAEEHVGEYLFWFDLSGSASTALEQLNHPEAVSEVEKSTADYVMRLAGIEKLTFSDGTPFASEKTKAWLRKIIDRHTHAAKGGIGNSSSGDALHQSITADLDKAREMKKSGNAQDALHFLEECIDRSRTAHESMLRRSALVGFLVEIKLQKHALPHLTQLKGEVEHFKLSSWDPQTALEVLASVYMAYKAQDEASYGSDADQTLEQIAGISPAAASAIEL